MMMNRLKGVYWHSLALLVALHVFGLRVQAQETPVRFIQETPWTVSALGVEDEVVPILAYWEPKSERYFLILTDYLELLGYRVETQQLQIEAFGERSRIRVDFEEGTVVRDSERTRLDSLDYFVSAGRFHLSFEGLQRVFSPSVIQFDHARLHMTHAAVMRRSMQPLSPLLYGRSRPLLGSSHIDYRLTRTQWLSYAPTHHGFFRTHTNALGGRIYGEGQLMQVDSTVSVNLRSLSYLLDFPQSQVLTHFEAGRLNDYGWPRQVSYDGIRLSNLPVADRAMQREMLLRGVAEPGAVVSASVGGVHVDRVYADQDGRYTLRIPAYYGSSQAQVEIAPSDGGPVTTRVHDLYVSQDLPPPGKLYYDARVGREFMREDELMVFAEARYGIASAFSIRAAYAQPGAPLVGLTTNWGGMSADVQVALPFEAGRTRLWVQHRRLRIQAEAVFSDMPAWSPYRRYYSGHLGWHFVRGSLFLQAQRSELFTDRTHHTRFMGSGTIRLSRSTYGLLSAGLSRLQWEFQEENPWQMRWSSTLTRTIGRWMRIGVHGEGGVIQDLDFIGLTMHGAWRWASLGLRVGYSEEFAASFTLRLDTPWSTVTNRSALGGRSRDSHSQSVYGSMVLGTRPQLMRQTQARSSAVIQAFVDADRDGRKDRDEAYLQGVEIEVDHAHVKQVSASMTRAELLVPHQRYQVRVNPRSLKHPRLVLTTGDKFSFIADPGQSKRIQIPVEKRTILEGILEDLPSLSAARIQVLIHENDQEIASYDVSQEGRFSGRLAPGTYRVELVDLLGRVDLSRWTQGVVVLNQPEQVLRLPPNFTSHY